MTGSGRSIAIRTRATGVQVKVRVVPNASRSRWIGPHGDALRIAVSAPPEKGRANRQLLEIVASSLGLERSQVSLGSGAKGRDKWLNVTGVAEAELRARLSRAMS